MNLKLNIGDTLCYIQHYLQPESYKVVTCKVDAIRIGKKETKVYTKCFKPILIDEINFNTDWLRQCKGLMLVQEPFAAVDDLLERAERWCERKGWLSSKI